MERILKALKALSDDTRLSMINLLLQRERCVCEVMQVLGISQTRASRNLSILYNAGFLKQRKEGLWSYYSIDKTLLEDFLVLLLNATEASLNSTHVANQDVEKLKKAKRLGPKCFRKG